MVRVNNLKRLRKEQGFSMLGLEAVTGVSTARIVGIERYNLYPGLSVRKRLSEALGVNEETIWPDLKENKDGEANINNQ